MSDKCSKCGEGRQDNDPAFSNGLCAFCGYWAITVGPERDRVRARRLIPDFSAMRPDEGVLTMAALQITKGLNPFSVRVSPSDYKNIELGLDYLHEYLDEEDRSYLVLRTPGRLLVFVDRSVAVGKATLICRSPDVELEFLLAY